MAQTWACLGHTDGTRACTYGLRDMCGVHLVAAMARGLVRLTSSPTQARGRLNLVR